MFSVRSLIYGFQEGHIYGDSLEPLRLCSWASSSYATTLLSKSYKLKLIVFWLIATSLAACYLACTSVFSLNFQKQSSGFMFLVESSHQVFSTYNLSTFKMVILCPIRNVFHARVYIRRDWGSWNWWIVMNSSVIDRCGEPDVWISNKWINCIMKSLKKWKWLHQMHGVSTLKIQNNHSWLQIDLIRHLRYNGGFWRSWTKLNWSHAIWTWTNTICGAAWGERERRQILQDENFWFNPFNRSSEATSSGWLWWEN